MGIKVRKNDQWVTVATVSLGTGKTKVALLKDEKNEGIAGGSFEQGAWKDRNLTVEEDPQGFVSFTAGGPTSTAGTQNQPGYWSLPAGTYLIEWSAPAHNVTKHQSLLVYSTTSSHISTAGLDASASYVEGSSEDITAGGSGGDQSISIGSKVITTTTTTWFKIMHRCEVDAFGEGMGQDTPGWGTKEIYTQVRITDLETAAGAGGGGGGVTDGDKGNITVSNSGTTWTIDNEVIEEKHINAGGTPANGKILKYDSTHATDWSWTDSGATVTTSDSAPASASAGDLWWNSSTGILNVYYTDADSSQWVNATGRAGGSDGSTSAITKVATVKDVKAYNVNGGEFTPNTWIHRTLNALSDPKSIGLSISGNIVTVPGGTYSIRWRAPGYHCNRHTSRLAYSSTSSTVASGITYITGETSDSNSDGNVFSYTEGVIASLTFSTTTYIKIEQWSEDGYTVGGSNSTGLGVCSDIEGTESGAGGSAIDSVYTTLVIEDLATAVKEPSGTDIPVGGIIMYSGTDTELNALTNWKLCDGTTYGSVTTPNLKDKFVIGADQYSSGWKTNVTGSLTPSGGSKDAVVVDHTHPFSTTAGAEGDHNHAFKASNRAGDEDAWSNGNKAFIGDLDSAAFTQAADTNKIYDNGSHQHSVSGTTDSTGVAGTNANLPPYFALAYIMRIS